VSEVAIFVKYEFQLCGNVDGSAHRSHWRTIEEALIAFSREAFECV